MVRCYRWGQTEEKGCELQNYRNPRYNHDVENMEDVQPGPLAKVKFIGNRKILSPKSHIQGPNALNVAIENLTKLGRDSQLILKQREARLVMECVEKLETK